jgi:hypothetical protein
MSTRIPSKKNKNGRYAEEADAPASSVVHVDAEAMEADPEDPVDSDEEMADSSEVPIDLDDANGNASDESLSSLAEEDKGYGDLSSVRSLSPLHPEDQGTYLVSGSGDGEDNDVEVSPGSEDEEENDVESPGSEDEEENDSDAPPGSDGEEDNGSDERPDSDVEMADDSDNEPDKSPSSDEEMADADDESSSSDKVLGSHLDPGVPVIYCDENSTSDSSLGPDDYNPCHGFEIFRESEVGVDAEDPDEELREHLGEINGELEVPSDDPVAEICDGPADGHEESDEREGVEPLSRFARKLQAAGYGEVDLPSSYTGDLDNEIHPIFQQGQWFLEDHFGPGNIVENDILWRRMQPSLRLASQFITNPNSMSWWVRLVHGKPHIDKATGKRYIPEPEDIESEGIAEVAALFERMSTLIRWSFCELNELDGIASLSWRSLREDPYLGAKAIHRSYHLPDQARPILINDKYKRYLLSEKYPANNSACMAVAVNWNLAITMVHELAHQTWFCLMTRWSGEPLFNIDDGYTELGFSWEASVYGDGRIGGYIDGRYGLPGLKMSPTFRSTVDNAIIDNMSFHYPVDRLWMHSFFLKKTWEEFNQLSGVEKITFWHPPTPSVAVFFGPRRRFDKKNACIWLSSEYPDTHRLSIQYWWWRMQDLIKRRDERKRIRRAKLETEQRDSDFKPGKRFEERAPERGSDQDLAAPRLQDLFVYAISVLVVSHPAIF